MKIQEIINKITIEIYDEIVASTQPQHKRTGEYRIGLQKAIDIVRQYENICIDCNGSGAVKTGEEEYSICPCVNDKHGDSDLIKIADITYNIEEQTEIIKIL